MKALILAAGLGTRLKPITDTIPKALFEVHGITLLEHALTHLKANRIREVIINVHHFPDMILDFLKAHDKFGLEIAISDESDELLETGVGLRKAAWFFSDGNPFLVRNVDVLSELDLEKMLIFHNQSQSMVTLAVRNRETSRYFLFNEQHQLSGWENRKNGERKITRQAGSYHPLAFSGIQIVSPTIFPLINEIGKFSLTELYLRISADLPIIGYREENSYWHDAGKLISGNLS